jgi:hypothetical protein
MNLLIYITALLLSLSALSYHSLQSFFTTSYSQALWDKELKEESSCRFNDSVETKYKKLSKTPSFQDEDYGDEVDEKDKKRNQDAAAGINFRFLVYEKTVEEHPTERDMMIEVAKNLITILYGEQEFFKIKTALRPDVVDALFEALIEGQYGPKKPTDIKKLEKISMNDPLLREFYYAIIKSADLGPQGNKAVSLGKKKLDCGSTSFADFLSNKSANKIRVFLAPSALLLALFQNEATVLSIIEMRKELHKEIKSKTKEIDAATQEFSSAFSGYSSYQEILDFNAGTTAPP